LAAAGLDPEADIERAQLGAAESVDAVKDGQLDAFFWSGGLPTAAITDLGATPNVGLKLLPSSEFVETLTTEYGAFYSVATIPAAIVGLLGESLISEHLGEPWQIAILLAAGAGLLWFADRAPQERAMGDLGMRHAVAMGLAQALALAPGVSRSGITITAGRLMRLDRDAAARFSFLLLLPTVLGALLLKGVGDVLLGDLPNGWQGPFLVGTLASLASGLLAIDWLLGYVRRHTYDVFVWYRLLAATIIGLLILSGVRAATF